MLVLTVDERVQDRHGTVRDTSIGVDLLEDYKRRVSIDFNCIPDDLRPRKACLDPMIK